MTGPIAITPAPTVGCAAARLQARRLSSQAATCSYATSPRSRKRVRDAIACRAAPAEVAEEPDASEPSPEEDEEDLEDLSEDLLKLLGPRTVPTPLLTPQEVSAPTTVHHLSSGAIPQCTVLIRNCLQIWQAGHGRSSGAWLQALVIPCG